jgi:RimJ/RimL family protein N-acetyltransferase
MDGGALQTAWPSSFPKLVTERLRLRAPSPRDATAVLAVVGDPEVTRYHSVPTLTTLAEAHAALERLEQRYAARDAIRWAIGWSKRGEAGRSNLAGVWSPYPALSRPPRRGRLVEHSAHNRHRFYCVICSAGSRGKEGKDLP